MTLPVIFIMLSNHFSFTYSHDWGWLILIALILIGMWIRHYFNVKHRGENKPWIIISGLLAFVVLMVLMAPMPKEPVLSTEPENQVTEQQITSLIDKHCVQCHSDNPTSPLFTVAPSGLKLDTLAQLTQSKQKVYQRTVISKDMPFGNMSNMTDDERDVLHQWYMQSEAN